MGVITNATVTGGSINVREKADSGAKLVTTLFKGDRIEVVSGIEDKYVKIILPEGFAYGNYGRYIKMDSDDVPQEPAYAPNVVVKANKISMRVGRGTEFSHVAGCEYLYSGDKAQLLDEQLDEDYAHVRVEKSGKLYEGYAYSDDGAHIRYMTAEPTSGVSDIIRQTDALIKTAVGGKYIYGAQGHKITTAYVKQRAARYPDYFTGNRKEMLLAIAAKCEAADHWNFPEDYAWDCSGLWWWAADKLNLFGTRTDSTANYMYKNLCDHISKEEMRAGDCAFRVNSNGKATHVAFYGVDDAVCEAMSGYVGVVKGDGLNDRTAFRLPGVYKEGQKYTRPAWNAFGRPKCFV